MAELRNGVATRWDWDKALRVNGFLNPFPRGITHADLDCEIEIHGRFLVVEGKRTGERLSSGQFYAMNARVRDGRTVLITYGDPDAGTLTHMEHWAVADSMPADWRDYYQFCKEWADWAESQSRDTTHPSPFRPSLRRVA